MLKNFLRDEAGQDIVEYSLLLVLLGIAAVFTMTALGQSVVGILNKINGIVEEVASKA